MSQELTDAGVTTALTGPPSIVLVPATVGSVGVVRAALRDALDEHCWETEPSYRVLLATSEAVANAIEHGSRPGDLVEVTYQVNDAQCFVRILDGGADARWDPPEEPDVPPVDDERGRGLIIIVTHAQHAEARPFGVGTEVRMTFSRIA